MDPNTLTPQDGIARLRAAGIPSPEADWRWLSEAFPDPVTLREALDRRCAREPLQLIIGSTAFRYLDLTVTQGVFIPRPETEWLVQCVLDQGVQPGAIVVEPCTGTGAISASLAQESPAAQIWATDINPAAVAVAKANTAAFPQVSVVEGNLLDPLDPALQGRVDWLVCNPPYLDAPTVAAAEPEVRDWDPYNALVGPGPDGWEIVRDLILMAPAWLAPGGWLALEDDPVRVQRSATLTRQWADEVRVLSDLPGRERFVMAHRPLSAA